MTAHNHLTGAQHRHSCPHRPEGADVPQSLTPAKPWGRQPICPTCNRGKLYSCICNVPEPEQEFFKPAVPHDPDGWVRIEL